MPRCWSSPHGLSRSELAPLLGTTSRPRKPTRRVVGDFKAVNMRRGLPRVRRAILTKLYALSRLLFLRTKICNKPGHSSTPVCVENWSIFNACSQASPSEILRGLCNEEILGDWTKSIVGRPAIRRPRDVRRCYCAWHWNRGIRRAPPAPRPAPRP